MTLLIFFGILSGITTILFGFGGGFVTVPLLYTYLLLQYPDGDITLYAMQISVATSALIMIFSAAISSYQSHKKGLIDWQIIKPLLWSISLGGCLGAFIASIVQGEWIRWIFIIYLAITIIDALFSKSFTTQNPFEAKNLQRKYDAILGVFIGTIAALLGVGGSIMTVPLMRKRGALMKEAAAMANPLTLPMAITTTIVYLLISTSEGFNFGNGFVGFLYLKAAGILIISAFIGIKIGARLQHYIPDKIYARAYPLLLLIVLLVMLLQ